jgi:nitronate monooxygenase
MGVLDQLALPIVLAPMAGGPCTPQLAAEVSNAGGLGFLAAGYVSTDQLRDDVAAARQLTSRPLGANAFVGGGYPADPERLQAYALRLTAEAERLGVRLGQPRFDDDAFDAKVAALVSDPVAVVSFTFGLPPQRAVDDLHRAGSEVWLTVTSPDEARQAAGRGADALIVQGVEAGGHRGVFHDDDAVSDLTLLAALQLIRAAVSLPLVAAGSIMTGAAVAAVLAAGASAAQLGTAYLRTTEAGTVPAQREATATDTPTVLTRAFTGRLARGISNRFHREHDPFAPRAYPEVHHLTSPLRAQARKGGDADVINLWAGQAHGLAEELDAAELTRRLAADARDALDAAMRRLRVSSA